MPGVLYELDCRYFLPVIDVFPPHLMSAVTRDSRDSMFIGPGLLNRETLVCGTLSPDLFETRRRRWVLRLRLGIGKDNIGTSDAPMQEM